MGLNMNVYGVKHERLWGKGERLWGKGERLWGMVRIADYTDSADCRGFWKFLNTSPRVARNEVKPVVKPVDSCLYLEDNSGVLTLK